MIFFEILSSESYFISSIFCKEWDESFDFSI